MENRLNCKQVLDVIEHLWPRKQLVRGCLMPSNLDDPEGLLDTWIVRCGNDLTKAEEMINHVHLPDLLICADDLRQTSSQDLEAISNAYVAFLDAEIRRVAPGATYKITVSGDFDKIPAVDFPDGRHFRLVDALDVQITCSLVR